MAFFSNEIAYTLQYFTFPLEIIGLTMASIEVRYPDKAVLISRIVSFQDKNTTLESFTDRWMNPSEFGSFRYKIIGLLILVAISMAVSSTITLGLFILAFAIFFMIRLTNRWVPDRAVGTLGIVIAGLGVLGEAYQFTTQLVT